MTSPANLIDAAQMNAAFDKVWPLPPATQAELKERRAHRKAKHLLQSKERVGANAQTVVR